METAFIGIREFSQKLFHYLRGNRPVVLMKRGKPFRLIRPISETEIRSLKKSEHLSHILSHKAIGIWKGRWPKKKPSSTLVQKMREKEDSRSLK